MKDEIFIEAENEDTIFINALESEDDNIDIEGLDLDDDSIQGFFSFIKKTIRKASSIVKKVSNLPIVGNFVPSYVKFGANFMNRLVKAEKKTGKKINFSATATNKIYRGAYLKGRVDERKKIMSALKRG